MAEFDSYAAGYSAGMAHPLKSVLGDSADDFVAIKRDWLIHRFPDLRQQGRSLRILDYGCGIATLLRLMARSGVSSTLHGCDISTAMLEEARRVWPPDLQAPEFHQQTGAYVPLPSETIDLVIISAVLHHVDPGKRDEVYGELHRLLRPGGRVVVFEHNPYNPVTRYVVAHTPIDQNAVLLKPKEVQAGLRRARFGSPKTSYLMFLPPRLRALSAAERAIGWLPLGGQYATTAARD